MQGRLTPLVDNVAKKNVFTVQVDGTQKLKAFLENIPLGNSLHFKTTPITVGEDVKYYPHVPVDWYRCPIEQTHMAESDWKYVEIKTKDGENRQVRIGSHLSEDEIQTYSKLLEEYIDVFAWSYKELKGIPPEVVKHRIPLILGVKHIRQKERRMNPQVQLLVTAELERLL